MKELTGTKTWVRTKSGRRKCKARVAGKYLGLFDSEAKADLAIAVTIDQMMQQASKRKVCADYVAKWFEERELSGRVRDISVDKCAWRTCVADAVWLQMEPKFVRTMHLQKWLDALAQRSGRRVHRVKVNGVFVMRSVETGQRLTDETLRKARSRVKLFFHWLKSKGICEGVNPVVGLIMPVGRRMKRVGTQRIVHLTGPEIRKLFAQPLPVDVRAIYAMAIYAGLRKSEIWAMRWEYVDFGARKLYVRNSRTGEVKTKTSLRDVTMLPYLRDTLEAHWVAKGKPESGIVFPTPGGGMRGKENTARWSDYRWRYRKTPRKGQIAVTKGWRTRAGIRPEVTFACFRHTCASQLLQGTVLGNKVPLTIQEVSPWLGHSSIQVTEQHYAEFSIDSVHRKVLGLPLKVETNVETLN